MQKFNHLKMEFDSLPENVSLARVVVASFAAQSDITISELEEIKVATSEAVSNAIIHGYENKPYEKVTLELLRDGNTLVITIEDFGVGIDDVEQATQPAFSTDPDRMGLGFVFMKSFMDNLEVESEKGKGTRVTMQKKLPSAGPALERDNDGQA